MNPKEFTLKLEDRLEGAIGERGKFTGYLPNGKKGATYQYQHINFEDHFTGFEYYGLSPVKIIQNGTGRKGVCRWIAIDIDLELKPEEICKVAFKIDPEVICFKTSSNRWHCIKFYDDWIDVEEARKNALDLESKFKKIYKKGIDGSHTLPNGYTIDQGKPGSWLFIPYGIHKELKNNKTFAYSPGGNPLSKSQCEFRITWRKHLLVSSSVGSMSGKYGRANYLFYVAQEIKQKNLLLTLDQVNSNFNEPLDDITLHKEIKHIEKSLCDDEFTKEYLEEHYESYLKKLNGYWRKDLKGVGVLDGFIDPEQEEKAKQFLNDVIYIKLDDSWYDKSTGGEYGEKAIKITYGHIFKGKQSQVINEFTSFEGAQLVEKGVYRPDLFKTIEDPIVKDEKGLLQLNQYRPSDLEPLPPDTPERKAELKLFLDLVKKLTEKEGTGTDSKGKEVDLYTYVLDFLSLHFQKPGVKVRNCICFHSEEKQLGKNTLFDIVRYGLGEDNCIIITPSEAIARERTYLEHQLVLIDEILIDGDYKKKLSTLNILKPLMTNEEHRSRPLFKNWRSVHSTMNMMMFTNHKEALAVKPNEARYTFIDIDKTREEMGGDEFFQQIWTPEGQIQGTIVNVVKHYLTNREISSNFNPKSIALKTDFLQVMSEEGGHPILKEIKPLVQERAKPFHQSVICISEAFEYLRKEKGIKGRINDLAEAFRELQFERVGEVKHKRTGRKPTLWLRDSFDFFCDKSMSSICNLYWMPMNIEEWNLSNGDVGIIQNAMKDLETYQDFIEGTPEEDPEEDFETIRRERAKRGAQ